MDFEERFPKWYQIPGIGVRPRGWFTQRNSAGDCFEITEDDAPRCYRLTVNDRFETVYSTFLDADRAAKQIHAFSVYANYYHQRELEKLRRKEG